MEAPASSGQDLAREPSKRGSRLLPVRVVASAPKARLVSPSSSLLELARPSGVAVRFPQGPDPPYLSALIAAL